MTKRVAIIGGGITGLTAAYELGKKGYRVTVYERSPVPGGLGTYLKIGRSYLERFYHHFFASDKHVIALIHELGIGDKLKFYRVKTGIFRDGGIHPFSSPGDLLRFGPLPVMDRIRCGIVLGFFKVLPVEIARLDEISAADFIMKYMGKKVYDTIWGPLLEGKFAQFSNAIPALWLWGRIHDRTFNLGYLDNSAQTLFQALIKKIKGQGGRVILGAEVTGVRSTGEDVVVTVNGSKKTFDECIITTVSPIAAQLIENPLDTNTKTLLTSQDQLGAVCVILESTHPIQSEYWLNICEKGADVLVAVEHTNLIDKKKYAGTHIIYLANYLHRTHRRFKQSDKEIINEYTEFLKVLNPSFKKSWIRKSYISKVPRAQTIFHTPALRTRPPHKLPVPHIYLANIDQMYPHDRNLNLGVLLGTRVARKIQQS